MAYSEDLRKKVMEYLESGCSQVSAQKVFNVSLSAIKGWKKQYAETGSLKNKPLNRTFKKLDPEKLTAYVNEHPDAYLKEIAEVFGCTDEAVRIALKNLKITRKKRQRFTESAARKSETNL